MFQWVKGTGTNVSISNDQQPLSESKSEAEPRIEMREFIEVVNWESFQYSDTRKKPNPPWRWFKIQTAFIYSPIWLSMTRQQRGDFVALLAAASQTGNLIPNDSKWLRNFGLSTKIAKNLAQVGAIRIFSLPADHRRIKALRRTFSGGAPDKEQIQNRTEESRLKSRSRNEGSGTPVHAKSLVDEVFDKKHLENIKIVGGQH